jgi:HlyD family secretion protein
MRRIILVIIVLLVAGGVLYTVQASGGRSASLPQAAPAAPAAPARLPLLSTDAVVATADVLPVTSAELNFAAPGLVSAVLVSDGESVQKDQALVRLDSKRQAAAVTQAQATLDRVQSVQAAARATLSRVQAVLAQLKAGPRPEDIATAVAVVNVAEAQLARAQAGADTTALTVAKANMEKAARAVQQAQAAYDRVKDAPFGSIGPDALRLEQATIDYDTAKTAYEQLVLGPRDVDVNVFKAQLEQTQAALAQAQLGARPEAIAAAEADVAAAGANAKATDSDMASAAALQQQAQDALADTELHAPFDGTVVSVNVKPGESSPVGSFAVRMADLSQWKIQTRDLTELSVSRVKLGDPADIKFDAIPDVSLSGKVSRIEQFGTNRQTDIVYAVVITPDTIDPRMRWNMTASVNSRPQ